MQCGSDRSNYLKTIRRLSLVRERCWMWKLCSAVHRGAGARFITSPGLVPDVLEHALANNVVAIPGALTPSEVIAAWKTGADFVKIFPCAQVGGDQYIRALKVPLPQIPLIASGGVNQLTAANFIFAGASSIGIGSELMPRKALKTRQDQWIRELARRYIEAVRNARIHMGAETD